MPAFPESIPPTRASATARVNSSKLGCEERWSETAISPIPMILSIVKILNDRIGDRSQGQSIRTVIQVRRDAFCLCPRALLIKAVISLPTPSVPKQPTTVVTPRGQLRQFHFWCPVLKAAFPATS